MNKEVLLDQMGEIALICAAYYAIVLYFVWSSLLTTEQWSPRGGEFTPSQCTLVFVKELRQNHSDSALASIIGFAVCVPLILIALQRVEMTIQRLARSPFPSSSFWRQYVSGTLNLATTDYPTTPVNRFCPKSLSKGSTWRFVNIITRATVALGSAGLRPYRPPRYQRRRTIYRLRPRLFAPAGTAGQPATRWYGLPLASLRKRHVIFRKGQLRRRAGAIPFSHPITARSSTVLRTAVRYDKTYFDKIVASLLPLLEKLTRKSPSCWPRTAATP